MYKHETKNCSRCRSSFECKAGSITQCQCNTVKLSAEERVYVESEFDDCLCAQCLAFLQKEYSVFREIHAYKQG